MGSRSRTYYPGQRKRLRPARKRKHHAGGNEARADARGRVGPHFLPGGPGYKPGLWLPGRQLE